MTDFKAKMPQIQFRLGLCPRTRWGSAVSSPSGFWGRAPCWIRGPLRGTGRGWAAEEEGKREGKGGRGKRRGGKGRAPKLLLNQGPSETCYVTESLLKY